MRFHLPTSWIPVARIFCSEYQRHCLCTLKVVSQNSLSKPLVFPRAEFRSSIIHLSFMPFSILAGILHEAVLVVTIA